MSGKSGIRILLNFESKEFLSNTLNGLIHIDLYDISRYDIKVIGLNYTV